MLGRHTEGGPARHGKATYNTFAHKVQLHMQKGRQELAGKALASCLLPAPDYKLRSCNAVSRNFGGGSHKQIARMLIASVSRFPGCARPAPRPPRNPRPHASSRTPHDSPTPPRDPSHPPAPGGQGELAGAFAVGGARMSGTSP
jgi:hypothetical protein